ncbi:hypothetical protein E4U30_004222 [Claviceps sp. LM220 group G6]|nr:hypothetical protein E4U30_004222 [Claviceps sp. LM220 group G6]KAG6094560.1 hypothetical protein E4U31_006233 [Claviceps sp. LM219 group G6]
MAARLRNTPSKIAGRSRPVSLLLTALGTQQRNPNTNVAESTSFGTSNKNSQISLQTRLVTEQVPSLSWFSRTDGRWLENEHGQDAEDPNKAKLGTTLRILQERLPTLLQSPLPQEILASNISLLLFPTTHPHLPAVSGKVAYNAALWTSPIAWNRVPIIGNVKLEILAERMTSEPMTFLPRRPGAIPEQLVVRWCEKRRSNGHLPEPGGIARALWRDRGVDPNKAFTGLFIFDFDAQGRILTHTIEQAQEGGDWEKGMGAKFVGLTDWLLGQMKDPSQNPIPTFERLK